MSVGRIIHGAKCPGASCPLDELSMEQVVHRVSCPWGELSMGWVVHGTRCPWGELAMERVVHWASCPWGEMTGASCRGATLDGASCPWGEFWWDELSGNPTSSLHVQGGDTYNPDDMNILHYRARREIAWIEYNLKSHPFADDFASAPPLHLWPGSAKPVRHSSLSPHSIHSLS
jgi:hypothetical protein